MKINKVRKQEMVTKFSWSTKISKSYICLFILAKLRVSTLLIILFYSVLLLRTRSYCIKKSTYFTIILMLWLASHFTEKLEQICTHIPYFYFAFSVLWSGPVEQLIKSEVLMTSTYPGPYPGFSKEGFKTITLSLATPTLLYVISYTHF